MAEKRDIIEPYFVKESEVEFFVGTFSHQIDGKNRIRIPAKFRTGLGKEYYFVASMEGCIRVYPEEVLSERVAALNAIRSGDPVKLRAKRKILSSIEKVSDDDQGRTLLSASLKKFAGIEKDVVTVGMSDYLEIWSKERFEGEEIWSKSESTSDGDTMTIDDAFVALDF